MTDRKKANQKIKYEPDNSEIEENLDEEEYQYTTKGKKYDKYISRSITIFSTSPKVYFYCPYNQTYTKFQNYNIQKICELIITYQLENYFIIQIDNDNLLYEEILKMQFKNESQIIHKMFDLKLDYSFSPFQDSLFFNMSILTDFFYDQIEKYLIQIFFHKHGIYIINKDCCENIHKILMEKFIFYYVDNSEFFVKSIRDKNNKNKSTKILINDFKLKKIIQKIQEMEPYKHKKTNAKYNQHSGRGFKKNPFLNNKSIKQRNSHHNYLNYKSLSPHPNNYRFPKLDINNAKSNLSGSINNNDTRNAEIFNTSNKVNVIKNSSSMDNIEYFENNFYNKSFTNFQIEKKFNNLNSMEESNGNNESFKFKKKDEKRESLKVVQEIKERPGSIISSMMKSSTKIIPHENNPKNISMDKNLNLSDCDFKKFDSIGSINQEKYKQKEVSFVSRINKIEKGKDKNLYSVYSDSDSRGELNKEVIGISTNSSISSEDSVSISKNSYKKNISDSNRIQIVKRDHDIIDVPNLSKNPNGRICLENIHFMDVLGKANFNEVNKFKKNPTRNNLYEEINKENFEIDGLKLERNFTFSKKPDKKEEVDNLDSISTTKDDKLKKNKKKKVVFDVDLSLKDNLKNIETENKKLINSYIYIRKYSEIRPNKLEILYKLQEFDKFFLKNSFKNNKSAHLNSNCSEDLMGFKNKIDDNSSNKGYCEEKIKEKFINSKENENKSHEELFKIDSQNCRYIQLFSGRHKDNDTNNNEIKDMDKLITAREESNINLVDEIGNRKFNKHKSKKKYRHKRINFSTDELIYYLFVFSLEKLEEFTESLIKEADSLKGIYLELSEKERKDFFRRIHSMEVSMHIIFQETKIKKKFFKFAKNQFRTYNKLSNDFYFKNNFDFFLELMISKITQIELTFETLESFLKMIKENYHIIIEDKTEKENIKLNYVMKVLTILTTIYAPMNIIPGLFGMNVKVPYVGTEVDSTNPFIFICVFLIFLILAQLIAFRKLNWF